MATKTGLGEVERARIAEEAYLFGFPIVLMETTRRLTTNVAAGVRPGYGPMNWFTHMRAFPPGDFREVVRPNYDTLYSLLWFDLRGGPLVVSVPDVGDRYYMLPLLDMWTEVFAVVGSRTTGTGSGHYALVGPGWSGRLPDGVVRIESPTPVGWAIGRIRTDGPADYEAVHALQDEFVATPLSSWPDEPEPPPVDVDDSVDMAAAPLDTVLAMSGVELLAAAAELMRVNAAHLIDQPVLARARHLGLVAGEQFDADGLDEAVRDAVEAGAKAARERMVTAQPRLHPVVDGWSQPTFLMGVYGADYLRRAVIAKVGLGANRAEDAVYPMLYHDAAGRPPVGDRDHVLHFAAGSMPPADAFWSVTMYDGEGFPVANDLGRYALGDRDPLVFNSDGSLDLYLQHDDPGPQRRTNWLPTPRGPIGVTMRLYDPRPEVLDGSWAPPPLTPARRT
jgi:hypothetical protein